MNKIAELILKPEITFVEYFVLSVLLLTFASGSYFSLPLLLSAVSTRLLFTHFSGKTYEVKQKTE